MNKRPVQNLRFAAMTCIWLLMLCASLTAAPYISEFMAQNNATLQDEDGDWPDWIEVCNPGPTSINLAAWHLTDDPSNLVRWTFPATNMSIGARIVVFASDKDRAVGGGRLHANFKLTADGEYLALVEPDGVTIDTVFDPFPPQYKDVSYGLNAFDGDSYYYPTPTPGAANGSGVANMGPVVGMAGHAPVVPGTNDSIMVTCSVVQAAAAVSNVTMTWRVMYNAETSVPMFDDGLHGDGTAGDGIYGAIISNRTGAAATYTAGQMVRWYIRAADVQTNTTRWPLFIDPLESPAYFGTVVQPSYVTSALPIFHLFINPANQAAADSEGGTRCAFYYDGDFYDNILIHVRGFTTAHYTKKSHHLGFNSGQAFSHPGSTKKISNTSLIAEYCDPAYLRQNLSFWLMAAAGGPAPFHYPVRVQNNGVFYQLAFHSDVMGADMVERLGYDRNGAVYKGVGMLGIGSSGEKKTRLWEDTSDYTNLAHAIAVGNTVARRRAALCDMTDWAEMVNYIAVARIVHENDDVWANMCLYRDTEGDQLWRIIAYDMNLSWGQAFNRPGFETTNDWFKAHPMYGCTECGTADGPGINNLVDAVVQVPKMREMLLRRMRTIMDTFLQPPGTTNGVIEQRIITVTNMTWREAGLDRAKWGWPPDDGSPYRWGTNLWLTNGVSDLVAKFVSPRRHHLYVTHCLTNTSRPVGIANANNAGIPLAQPTNVLIHFLDVESSPASGDQNQEYVCLTNRTAYAVDMSQWVLTGDVSHVFRSGTVIPARGALYVTPRMAVFRTRTTGPRTGQGLLVQGDYKDHLSSWGGTVLLHDNAGRLVSTHAYTGTPTVVQHHLRISEMMYSPPVGGTYLAEDYEYIEFYNTATWPIAVTGAHFTAGIQFTCGPPVTVIQPTSCVVLVRNVSAFAERYATNTIVIAGVYSGKLNNDGERIKLDDNHSGCIHDFTYTNGWYPETDGTGWSLEVADPYGALSNWDTKAGWRPSEDYLGTPGFRPLAMLDITNVTGTLVLPDTSNTWPIAGTNNVRVVGGMVWTNAAIGGGNGTLIPASGNWTFNVALISGFNVVTVYGTNVVGELATDSVTIVRGIPPMVDITNLVTTSLIKYPSTVASQYVAGTNTATMVGGMAWTNSLGGGAKWDGGGTNWCFTATLFAGTNIIIVSGTNVVGAALADTVSVYRARAPHVTMTNDNVSVSMHNATAAICGTNNEGVVGFMSLQSKTGEVVNYSITVPAATPWSLAISNLIAGTTNFVTMTVTNDMGEAALDTVWIYRRPVAVVDITNLTGTVVVPTNVLSRFIAGTNNVHVVGRLTWTSSKGYSGSVAAGGWSFSTPLTSGENIITVYGTNTAGDVASDSVTIVRHEPVKAGLVMWLDASQIVGLTNGQQVDIWPNAVDAANNAVRNGGSSAGYPRYATNQIGGLPVVRFSTDANSYYAFNQISTIRSVFWVIKETTPGRHHLLGEGSNGTFHRSTGGPYPMWSVWTDPNITNGVTKLMGTVVDGTVTPPGSGYRLVSLVTVGDVNASQLSKDRWVDRTSWDGDIAELLIYTNQLSSEEEIIVGMYLANKYRLSTAYLRPQVDITCTNMLVDVNTPPPVVGTNNLHVVGTMWISNAANGAVSNFPAALVWTATPVRIELFTSNLLYVFGSNTFGAVTNDTVVFYGVPEPCGAVILCVCACIAFAKRFPVRSWRRFRMRGGH